MKNLVNTLNLKQNMIANDTYTATSDMFNFDALFTCVRRERTNDAG